jgi:hypothetical protein
MVCKGGRINSRLFSSKVKLVNSCMRIDYSQAASPFSFIKLGLAVCLIPLATMLQVKFMNGVRSRIFQRPNYLPRTAPGYWHSSLGYICFSSSADRESNCLAIRNNEVVPYGMNSAIFQLY